MTEWEARLAGTFPVGDRVGRVRCVSGGGGIIAWIMRTEDGSIQIARPPTKPLRRGQEQELHLTDIATPAARSGFLLLECPACGSMEVSAADLLDAAAHGGRDGVVKL